MSTASKKRQVAIFGAGRVARAVAHVLGAAGANVVVFARNAQAAQRLSEDVGAQIGVLPRSLEDFELVFLAVPADALAEVARTYGEHAMGHHVVLHATRGVGPGFLLPHQIIRANTSARKIGALGGPLFSPEANDRVQLAAVVASRYPEVAKWVEDLVAGGRVIVQSSRDIIGVEVAGVMANVTAIATGISDALEFGDTARGILMTRGLIEARTLGTALGAEPSTFSGLAGIGELIPRRVTTTDRHHALGRQLAQGQTLTAALAHPDLATGALEGIDVTREAVGQANHLRLSLPLTEALLRILNGSNPKDELEAVLKLKLELEVRGSRPLL